MNWAIGDILDSWLGSSIDLHTTLCRFPNLNNNNFQFLIVQNYNVRPVPHAFKFKLLTVLS